MPWLKAVFIAFDQLINAILGGWPDNVFYRRRIVFLIYIF